MGKPLNIKEALLRVDLTATGLAEKAGLHPNTVWHAINGARMTPRTAYKLEKAFGALGCKITLSGQDRRARGARTQTQLETAHTCWKCRRPLRADDGVFCRTCVTKIKARIR